MGTRTRIWLTMILLGYPLWAIGASTCSLAAGEKSSVSLGSQFIQDILFARNRLIGGRILL